MDASALDIERATRAYIEAALWAGLDIDREDAGGHNPPLDANYEPSDLAPETLTRIRAEVSDFAEANAADLADIEPEQMGHDFYLTRNRHGAGFWDRGLGEIGDRLTEAAHVYGESDLYAGDDGRLYVP